MNVNDNYITATSNWSVYSGILGAKGFIRYLGIFRKNDTKVQGLTQTFTSSGSQDYQLRRSGGPTIFLVALTTNVTYTWKY